MENVESQSAKDSLQFIESMIHKAQNRYSENGTFITSIEVILLLVPAVLFGWIIPGYLLKARFKSA